MGYKAVIFDFDGTLADTIPAIREGINLTMEQYGFPIHTDDEVRTFINNGPRLLVKRALPAEVREDEALLDRVVHDYNELYQSVCAHTDRPYNGIPQLLSDLRADGYRIGVLSNKPDFLVRPMCATVIPGMYDAALGSFLDRPSKPDPYLSNRIAQMLDVPVRDCIFVGDSDVDVRTAKNVGMAHIGITWGYRDAAFLCEAGATVLADTPQGLYTAIKQLNKGKED